MYGKTTRANAATANEVGGSLKASTKVYIESVSVPITNNVFNLRERERERDRERRERERERVCFDPRP